jgi:catechol 2,3-dioxygenase-like lactoylglutathione lyase family enzyme
VGLSDFRVSAQIAVSDLARVRAFYESVLGLSPTAGPSDLDVAYPCGGGSVLYVYESPTHAGKSTATIARWDVDDIDRVVDELTGRGVRFERYGEPVKTDARGIHDSGYGKVAWFKDPDGNLFAIELNPA